MYVIQGVPKVLSSNFMHYSLWSKLYFYMKYLTDVYSSTEYMHSEFQLLACAFWFFITFCSRCGMKWDTACRPTEDPLGAFLSPGAREPVNPRTLFVYFRQLKKYILGIHPKKIMIPASFHSKAFEYFFTNLRPAGRYLADQAEVFFAISGASNFKHFKQLFMTLSGLGSLTMCELPCWVSYFVSSLL